MMKPKEVVELILQKAPTMLKQEKHHAPILFIFGGKGDAVVLVEYGDTDSKYKAMLTAGRKAAELLPYCIAFVSEAWISKTMPPEGKEVHDMDDKEECLIITANGPTGESCLAIVPFCRIGGEIILGETTYADAVISPLLENFWLGIISNFFERR